jgi:hypothetical protein
VSDLATLEQTILGQIAAADDEAALEAVAGRTQEPGRCH